MKIRLDTRTISLWFSLKGVVESRMIPYVGRDRLLPFVDFYHHNDRDT